MSVTFITVCYNCIKDIDKTISNVLSFVNEGIEYLVIDGGSTDGTLDLLKSHEAQSHFRYISETDSGIYNAMNKGARMVETDWFCFINCGDILRLIPQLGEYRDAQAVCFAVETENGVVYPEYNSRLLFDNTLPHQGLFYRKRYFRGFDESYKIFADYALNIDMYKTNAVVYTSNTVVAFHSLIGISNLKMASTEFKRLLKDKNSIPIYILAMLYAKYRGIKHRISKL